MLTAINFALWVKGHLIIVFIVRATDIRAHLGVMNRSACNEHQKMTRHTCHCKFWDKTVGNCRPAVSAMKKSTHKISKWQETPQICSDYNVTVFVMVYLLVLWEHLIKEFGQLESVNNFPFHNMKGFESLIYIAIYILKYFNKNHVNKC